MNEKKYTNALAEEDSLYLQQHAHNPVNWLPWGDEAKQKAKDQNKLMLVSIGYSSCHWCHVMERESFEDEEVAELMNRNFVCIKVDREERPDVDQIYMEAVQMMSGQGGWPLNCFTNPLGEPVYGGTYFPKEQWMKVLDQLAQLWKDEPEKVNDYGRKLREGMKVTGVLPDPGADPDFPKSSLSETVVNWKKRFDNERGGPNKAPKFPLPSNYFFLMKYARITEDSRLENHVRLTLDRMSIGGIYDQVGGGFTRYSTDPDWKVPHFEKMLYDNAQLLELYSEAFGAYKDPEYAHTARGIINWLRREMKNPEGGYYSAIDADSEGEEGKFYTWEESITEEVDLYGKYYHSDHRAMWEGKLIPVRKATLEELSKVYEMPLDELEEEFDSLNLELLKKRQKRVRPATDDKSLCSWNAMLVSGFAAAYEFLGEEDYLNEAKNILSFIDKAYFSPDEVSLKHTWKNGNAKVDGFLEDYAFLIRALLKLYQISFDQNLLSRAKELTFQTLDRFYDDKSGIFYFTSNQQDDLVARPMDLSDNVIPSSNSVMAANLLELSAHFGLSHFEKCGLRLLKAVEKGMIEYGSGYSNWAEIWLKKTLGSPELVVSGPDALAAIQRIEGYYPMLYKAAAESDSDQEIFKGRFSNQETRFFVCKNHSCNRPTLSAKETESELQKAYRQN